MEVLLIVILVFILMGYLIRFIAPYLLRAYLRRMEKRFGAGQTQQRKKEGEVTVDATIQNGGKKKKKVAPNVGDYVDFEEVK